MFTFSVLAGVQEKQRCRTRMHYNVIFGPFTCFTCLLTTALCNLFSVGSNDVTGKKESLSLEGKRVQLNGPKILKISDWLSIFGQQDPVNASFYIYSKVYIFKINKQQAKTPTKWSQSWSYTHDTVYINVLLLFYCVPSLPEEQTPPFKYPRPGDVTHHVIGSGPINQLSSTCSRSVAGKNQEDLPIKASPGASQAFHGGNMDDDVLTTLKLLIIGESGVGKSRFVLGVS